jgi:hypothetical protein
MLVVGDGVENTTPRPRRPWQARDRGEGGITMSTPQVRPEVQAVNEIAQRLEALANDGNRALWQLGGIVRLFDHIDIERMDGDTFDIIVHCVERVRDAWEQLLPNIGGPGPCDEIRALASVEAGRRRAYWDKVESRPEPDEEQKPVKAGQRVARAQSKKPPKVSK